MMRYKIISLVLLILSFNCDKLFPEDNEGPIISILKPVNFDIVNESVKILPLSPNYDIPKVDIFLSKVEPVLISDSTLIEKFKNKEDFYEEIIILDKQLIGTDTDGKPLKFLWNTTTKLKDYCCSDYPDSSVWFLTVEGYDSKNNKTQSEGIFLMVDNSVSNPDSININSVMLNQDGNFIINWDRSYESDFYSYILTKSLNNDMSNNDTIFQTFNIDSISFVDSLINPLIYQYYAITVIDTFDYFTKGPIFSSSLDQHPISISIYDVKYDYDSMTVIWEKSIDSDIEQVKLLYSLSESVSKDTIFTTNSLNDTIFSIREFDPTTGSDERQYNSAELNLPVGQISRTLYGSYHQYHNSGDDKNFMKISKIIKSINEIEKILKLNENLKPLKRTMPFCEIQLGKRGLYPNINSFKTWKDSSDTILKRKKQLKILQYLFSYADGKHNILDISNLSGFKINEIEKVLKIAIKRKLIKI